VVRSANNREREINMKPTHGVIVLVAVAAIAFYIGKKKG
jgi:hypothetical protein